jgi:exoribonuclease R
MTTSQQTQTQLYKVQIEDREYTSWSFLDPDTDSPKTLTQSESIINPINLKLFSGDLIDLSTPIPTVLYSPTKSKPIPGILILAENKTYGRTANNKRLLYKCIPNNPEIPAFLLPYQPDILFSKIQKNRYVIFRFDNWNSKYPQGILTENLGDTDNLPAFYEYQLFCRNIHHPIAEFNAAAKNSAKQLPTIKANNPHLFQETDSPNGTATATRKTSRIFSIDPPGTKDFDDAFSISKDSPFTVKIRIYIANMYAWMDAMGLWAFFGERVSTIYLPDSRRPMLPSILSESVCSLVADKTAKLAFCMELRVRINGPPTDSKKPISMVPLIIPDSVRFFNQPITVDKNYVYESRELLVDTDYQLLHKCTQILDTTVRDSHDVVSYWMIRMNSICGEWLHERGVGIFREVSINKMEDPEPPFSEMPNTTKILLKNWKNTTGKYICYDNRHQSSTHTLVTVKHTAMGIDSYVHITSPIRRLVDLLNQIIFQREFGLVPIISAEAEDFLATWSARIDEINIAMRSIRKTQIDCDMLFRCNAHPEWMQHPHRGVIFDRIENPDGNYSYMVHLSELNILGRLLSQEKYINYQVLDFRLFVFQDSDKLQRKIRLVVA